MKISVRDGKFRLSLRLPLGICLRGAATGARGGAPALFGRTPRAAAGPPRRAAPGVHGAPELVRVEGADGSTVIVTL